MELELEWTPPRPKSPPGSMYGKRCHLVKLHLLEKEITSLQDELKSLDRLQPSSGCCQEVNEFVSSREDPLIAMDKNPHKPDCCWTITWGKSCLRSPKWNCCLDENKMKRQSNSSGGNSSRQHKHQQGCWLCCANEKRRCSGATAVSCSRPPKGWRGCGFKLSSYGCNGGANCWPRCNCCCSSLYCCYQ